MTTDSPPNSSQNPPPSTSPDSQNNIVWFHCFSGIAGDMALASLIDAGADIVEVQKMCQALPIEKFELRAEKTQRCGISAKKVDVIISENPSSSRTAKDIFEMLNTAFLPPRVKERAVAVFEALAQAEGKIHNKPPAEVHFHEVGAMDSILDIVGTAAALEVLNIDNVYSSPVANGIGSIKSAHGEMPNPPPATVELLKDVPIMGLDINAELTTPTGAAILKALAQNFGPPPAMTIKSSGFGAGTNDFENRPNLTQAVMGQSAPASPPFSRPGQPALLLETNLDDTTGEVISETIGELLKSGAADAWTSPALMKKGRPGNILSFIADPADFQKLAEIITSRTGTFGIRAQAIQRWPSSRRFDSVLLEGHTIGIKFSKRRIKAEPEDVKKVAALIGRSPREVAAAAEGLFRLKLKNKLKPDN